MGQREVGIMELVEPEYLSLVGSPANRTGFKIIRSNNTKEGTMAHKDRNIRVRSKALRSDGSLLSLDFPTGLSEEDAADLFASFSLGDDYELARDDNGDFYAKRKDSDDVEGVPIELGNGYTATVSAAAITRSDKSVAGVTLVGLEFDENFVGVDAVKQWLEDKEINFKEGGVESFEGGTAVTRHDVPEGTEVRKVRLDVGVTGLVSKTADNDVPTKVYRSVVEQSYGNWGWGHLNFGTALADPAFSDASWDAIWVLRDVLENVVLYSGLPLDDRKSLVQNACDQFVTYMTGLIDALPNGVIEQARADRKSKQETSDMAKNDEGKEGKTVKREDGTENQDVDNTEGTDTTQDDDKGGEFVTRKDLETVVAAAVTSAMENVARNEDGEGEDGSDDKGEETVTRSDESGEISESLKILAGAIEKQGQALEKITRSVGTLKDEVEDLGGTTTVSRSDDDDSSDLDEEDGELVKRKDGETCFTGMFGDRFQ